jgi:hypothetical protein
MAQLAWSYRGQGAASPMPDASLAKRGDAWAHRAEPVARARLPAQARCSHPGNTPRALFRVKPFAIMKMPR